MGDESSSSPREDVARGPFEQARLALRAPPSADGSLAALGAAAFFALAALAFAAAAVLAPPVVVSPPAKLGVR